MVLDHEDLCQRAAQLELESKKLRFDDSLISALEVLLLDVYGSLRPTASDYEQRKILVQMFNDLAKNTFGNNGGFPVMEPFGSFIMDLFTNRSDLDLSINFNNDLTTGYPHDRKVPILKKFAKTLYAQQRQGHVSGVTPVLRARVPVLKVVNCQTGIECDISVENKDGISRSSILKIISSLDERFRILCYLMKVWAMAHNINSPKDRTMSSLAIISLVAFHLQTREPPILPPFSILLQDGTNVSSVQEVVSRFSHFSRSNQESISKLFVTLLDKLSSAESLWQHGLCASTCDGRWISKTWKSGIANMSVEDFLDRNQNIARAVEKAEMKKINQCILSSLDHLSGFMDGRIEASELKSHLFGSVLSDTRQITGKGQKRKKKIASHGSARDEATKAKKAQNSHLKTTAQNNPKKAQNSHLKTPAQNNRLPAPSFYLSASQTSALRDPSFSLNPAFAPSQQEYLSVPHSQTINPPFAPQHGYQMHHSGPSSLPFQSAKQQWSPHVPLRPDFTPKQPNYQMHHLGSSSAFPSQSGYGHPIPGINSMYRPSVPIEQLHTSAPSNHQMHHFGSSSVPPSQYGYGHPRPGSNSLYAPSVPLEQLVASAQPNHQMRHPPQSGYGRPTPGGNSQYTPSVPREQLVAPGQPNHQMHNPPQSGYGRPRPGGNSRYTPSVPREQLVASGQPDHQMHNPQSGYGHPRPGANSQYTPSVSLEQLFASAQHNHQMHHLGPSSDLPFQYGYEHPRPGSNSLRTSAQFQIRSQHRRPD